MKIVIATDSFKGCLTSEEVESTLAQALSGEDTEVLTLPMSDGGEGMLEAFVSALHGSIVETEVHNPLMQRISAPYGIAPDGTAVIESARACGLTLMKEDERNPLVATTYGVGELIADALCRGCRTFIIGLGGSGTSDAGKGMLQALADRFTGSKSIDELPSSRMPACRFLLASDVRNPLYGENGAAFVFGPQKGATPQMVEQLDRQARLFACHSAAQLGRDASQVAGAGAAGGLGYAFIQYFRAEVKSGADLLLRLIRFDETISNADLIITGEGRADRQTLMGKLPERILRSAQKQHIPVWLVAGQTSDTESLLRAGFARADGITPAYMPIEEAMHPETARKNLQAWVSQIKHRLPALCRKPYQG